MEDLSFIALALIVAAGSYLIMRAYIKERAEDRRERRRSTAPARAARHPIPGAEVAEVGEWLPKLLESFGIDPEVILEDEMPEELRAALPFIKGYLGSGGLQKLLQGTQGAQPPPGEGEEDLSQEKPPIY
jgi:hypothetical protein